MNVVRQKNIKAKLRLIEEESKVELFKNKMKQNKEYFTFKFQNNQLKLILI